MVIKICYKCNIEKEFPDDFTKGKNFCKQCRNKELKIQRGKKRIPKEKVSKEHKLKKIKEWQKNNPEKRQAAIDKYHATHIEEEKLYRVRNKDKILKRVNEYVKNNREILNSKLKERRKNPIIKLRHSISTLVRMFLKGTKKGSILKYLPYTIQELKNHIESQFEPWMTWNNYGVYNKNKWNDNDPLTWTWQLDHIIPQYKLQYLSMEDDNFKKCWALENLRPLSAKQNVLDGVSKRR